MLRAHVAGGIENVLWKYTTNAADPECMVNWHYYAMDRKTVLKDVPGRTIAINETMFWCALPVSQEGGIRGKQWEFCNCKPISALSVSVDGCSVPTNGISNWQYDSESSPIICTSKKEKSGRRWAMPNTYRSGGSKWKHWKYSTNPNDPECLMDWTYYAKDGVTKIADISGRLTTLGDKSKKSWCAMAVYRPSGKRGYQWDYCICP